MNCLVIDHGFIETMSPLTKRIALLIEPLALLVVLGLLARWLNTALGLDASAVSGALLAQPPRWLDAAAIELPRQLVKWTLLLSAAWLLCRIRGYSMLRPVREVRVPLSILQKIALGVSVAVPLHWLATLPRWIHFEITPLGQVPAVWGLIYTAQWTPEFWAFMAVSSFVLPPLVEELFFRGYLLGSLLRAFGTRAAVVLMALLFAGVHLQYAAPDPFAVYNALMVFVGAVVMAVLVTTTGSLLPAVAAHVVVNTPQPLSWAPWETISALLVIAWLCRRRRPKNT